MKKFFKISGITIVLLIVLLLTAPFIFKGKIIRIIKETANENVLAKIDFDENISLSLIKNFPDLSLGIKNLSVIGLNDFEGDTLYFADNTKMTLDLNSVFKGEQIQVKTIFLEKPVINLLINKNNDANWDIMLEDSTETEEESSFSMKIKSLEVQNAKIYYEDKDLDFTLLLENFNHNLEGDFTLSDFILKTKSEAEYVTMTFEGVKMLNRVHSDILADLNINTDNFKFEFLDNKISLNELDFSLDGWLQLNDEDIDFDLVFDAAQDDFKNFISLIPAVYSKDFEALQAKGEMKFNGYFKGKMTDDLMPGYGITLNIDNGYFKYPDLPAALENVFVNLDIDNKTGLDKDFSLNLSKLNLTMDKNPFEAVLSMKNMDNPKLDGKVKGQIDLASVNRLVHLDKTEMSGILKADMQYKGYIAKLESGNYEDIDASGSMSLTEVFYKDEDFPEGINIEKMALEFTPKQVNMPALTGKIGETDFDANGSLSNFFAYALSDGTLKGNLNFVSNNFNANQFMTDEEAEEEDDEDFISSIEIPDNIDFDMNVLISKLKYDNLNIENLKGNVLIKESKINFNDAGMELIGGTMLLNGVFDGQNVKMPFANLDLKMTGFDIPKAFTYFDMLQKYAPFAEKMTGLFSMNLEMESNLDNEMNLIYPSITAKGSLSLSDASLSNLKIMNILADQLKLEKFRKLELKNQTLEFAIDKGKFLIDSFVLPLWKETSLALGGFSTIEDGLNYVGFLTIPRKDLGLGNTAIERLISEAGKRGINVEADEIINIAMNITGSFTNPQIKLDIKEAATNFSKSLVDQAKKQVKDKIDEKVDNVKKDVTEKVDEAKEEARKKAQEEADKIIAVAQAQADKITAEAKKQADAIRFEANKAGNKLRDEADSQGDALIGKARNQIEEIAAKRAADKLKSEAEDKASKLENEAEKKALKIEETAQQKADEIMSKARKKADDTVNKI